MLVCVDSAWNGVIASATTGRHCYQYRHPGTTRLVGQDSFVAQMPEPLAVSAPPQPQNVLARLVRRFSVAPTQPAPSVVMVARSVPVNLYAWNDGIDPSSCLYLEALVGDRPVRVNLAYGVQDVAVEIANPAEYVRVRHPVDLAAQLVFPAKLKPTWETISRAQVKQKLQAALMA